MNNDYDVFTLASVAALPFTAHSRIMVARISDGNSTVVLHDVVTEVSAIIFEGTFEDFGSWIHNSKVVTVYTPVRTLHASDWHSGIFITV